MKRIIIFIGHPAGGKTSTAYKLAEKLGNSKVIRVDEIKIKISGSVFGKDDAERELWFKEINKQIKQGLKAHDNVIVDEGFFAKKYFNKILKGVENIKRIVIEINYILEEHIKRNKKRGEAISGPVKKMYELWNSIPEKERIEPDIKISDKNLSIEKIIEKIIVTELSSSYGVKTLTG